MPEVTVREYEVRPALGRHLVLDPRSLAYRRAYDGQPLRATAWEPRIPVLDQQNLTAQGIHLSKAYSLEHDLDALASCTGNAATAALSVLLTKDRARTAGLDTDDATAAQRFAIDLYAQATEHDQWHDLAWPVQDCGSSGLGIAKAMKTRGLIDQYAHATTAEELCTLLQTGPVLMGLPWRSAFNEPDSEGFIDSGDWASSPLEGGHEVCVTALEAVATSDGVLLPEHCVLRFRNSWGSSYGEHGDARMFLTTYLALRDQIDLIQPRLDPGKRR
ncbi:hypothetical protein ACFQ0X_44205 [Streptomyces rectiviolaceus]|uniref:Peptidase C1A papain C-terminal domain-containing protein n=1 Tax=Streptomyces rectiviolaceus TaxID=332591 RepID=A0ABP6NMH2_9ACTN